MKIVGKGGYLGFEVHEQPFGHHEHSSYLDAHSLEERAAPVPVSHVQRNAFEDARGMLSFERFALRRDDFGQVHFNPSKVIAQR
jgi:hypothetical protein